MFLMEEFIMQNAHRAHWFVFGAILLAGLNIPISIDVLIILSAVLAATAIPEHVFHLYFAVFLGCYFSAMIAYGVGRFLGPKLLRIRWFANALTPERMEKIKTFTHKHGFLTLVLGRFIPFGVRNCIFMTSGISKLPFLTFIMRDLIACLTWSSVCFTLCYFLGKNYNALISGVKVFNLLIFSAFAVTVIGFFWYKKRKKSSLPNENS